MATNKRTSINCYPGTGRGETPLRLVGDATTVKVGSGLPFAAFYCGDGIYCPIVQAVFSKPSSGADHGAADDAGE